VLGTLSNFCGLEWDKFEICSKTLALEQLLTTGGGWQDQVGGVLHGVKLIETTPGFEQTPVVRWLPTDLFDSPQTKGIFLLYYTGITRTAKNILAEIVRGMFLNSSSHLNTLGKIKQHAGDVFEAIMRGDHVLLASSVAKSWKLNMELDGGTCTPDILKIVEPVSNDLLGFKLLGAGGGGFMLMVAKDLEAAARVRGHLEANPINSKARFVEMTVSKTGFLVTRS
jgi:galactokinase/mevalonate kinase-like predicted kinase